MPPLVVNLQKKLRINTREIRSFVVSLETLVPEAAGKSFSLALISDRRMSSLNEMFRGRAATTDVLSFPHEPDAFDSSAEFLGDIVVSVEQAERQASENDLTLENEIRQLILHGLLHLCGFDHETDGGEMNAREIELRDKLGI